MNEMQEVYSCQNWMTLKRAAFCQQGLALSIRLKIHLELKIKRSCATNRFFITVVERLGFCLTDRCMLDWKSAAPFLVQ